MHPQPTFCPNLACPSRGRSDAGNVRAHDSLRNRWRCTVWKTTFSGRKATAFYGLKDNDAGHRDPCGSRKATAFYGLKTEPQIVVWVGALLAFGCPPQAIVAAFGLDERTVALWQKRAGQHCEAVHAALVQTPQDLAQVQADEIRVRCQKRLVVWLAMAICVPTRLWLGGVVSAPRDKGLARALANKVNACACCAALLVVTDGWRVYQDAFVKAFRQAVRSGRRGRPRLVVWPAFVLAQTVKWQEAGRTIGIKVCHLYGSLAPIAALLPKEQVLSTAYIERLNAPFRQRLSGLCRRTRTLLRSESSVQTGMYLVGTVYNFCTPHQSLHTDRQPRTPAMAAGLTGHIWSIAELLGYQVAPAPYVAPKRRGRPPGKKVQQEHKGANALVTV